LVGAWLDDPAAEGDGEVGLAVALDVPKTLKRLDPAGDAEAGEGAGEVEGARGGAAGELGAAFGEEGGDLGVGGGGGPQGHPLFASGALVGVGGAAITDGGGAQGEGGGGLGQALGVGAAGEGGAEEQGALEHQDKVPGVDGELFGEETRALVGAARAAGEEEADGGALEAGGRGGEEGGFEVQRGLRGGGGFGGAEVKEAAEAAHVVVGKIEAAVVAAGAEQGGVGGLAFGVEHEYGVEPGGEGTTPGVAAAADQGGFGLLFGGLEESVGDRFAGEQGFAVGAKAGGVGVGDRVGAFGVVLGKKAAAAVPRGDEGGRGVGGEEELKEGGAIQAGEEEEALTLPPAADLWIGLLGDQAEHGEGL
jgi:hypothetical protein